MPLCLCACSRDHTAQLPEVNASNVHHPPVAVGGWWGTKPGFALGTSGFASGYAVTSRRGRLRPKLRRRQAGLPGPGFACGYAVASVVAVGGGGRPGPACQGVVLSRKYARERSPACPGVVAVGGGGGRSPASSFGLRRGIFRSEQSAQNEKWWSRRGRHCGPAAECGRSRGGRRPAGAGRRGGRAAYGHPLVGRRPIPGQGAECARTPALVGSE